MDKAQVLSALGKARKSSKKRNFSQTFDLVINLKDINLKKPEENINTFINLANNRGKKVRVCAFVGGELAKQAKEICDKVILEENFAILSKDKKAVKQLAKDCDFFVAQANLMSKVATSFGKLLGPLGKMPNPKAGCIVPPNANLKPLYEKLQKTVKLQTKNELIIKLAIGIETMKDEEIADNIISTYRSLIPLLPQEKQNIKSMLIKLTMGKVVNIGESKK